MKILLHTIHYSPETVGIGQYVGELADWLAEQGHHVRVVTAPPFFPEWAVQGHYPSWVYWFERVRKPGGGRIGIIRCPLWIPRKPNRFTRLIHLFSFALTSLPVMLLQVLWRPAVVWVVEPPTLCAPQAWLTARLSGAKAWLHVQDFEIDAALGHLEDSLLLRGLLRLWERGLLKRFDRVSTITAPMLDCLHDKGVDPRRSVLCPNWVDVQAIRPFGPGEGPMISPYRQDLHISVLTTVVLYTGSLEQGQGVEVILDAAEHLKRHGKVVFVICGDGELREAMEDSCRHNPAVRFLPPQPRAQLNLLYNFADLHVIPARTENNDLQLPGRVSRMLASGRPVVATARPGTALARIAEVCGKVVPPQDPRALADAVRHLVENRESRLFLGKMARAYAERRMDRSLILGRLQEELKAVVKPPQKPDNTEQSQP